jgi:hypothetical protein
LGQSTSERKYLERLEVPLVSKTMTSSICLLFF